MRETQNTDLNLTLTIGDLYPETGLIDLEDLMHKVCHAILTEVDAEYVGIISGETVVAEVHIEDQVNVTFSINR